LDAGGFAGGAGGELGGGGDAGGGEGGAGAAACPTAICKPWSFTAPLASDTVTPKLKFPAAVGVPETFPVPRSRFTPWGICPEVTAKL